MSSNGFGGSIGKKAMTSGWNLRNCRYEGWNRCAGKDILRRANKKAARRRLDRMARADWA